MATLNEVIEENNLKVGTTEVPRAIEIRNLRDVAYTAGMNHDQFANSTPDAVAAKIEGSPYDPTPEEPEPEPEPEVTAVVVTPAEGAVTLQADESLVLTIAITGEGFTEVEVDHSASADMQEFTLLASAANPYGTEAAAFASAGIVVTYNEATKTFVIDFGDNVTTDLVAATPLSVYLAVKDAEGNYLWGNMNTPTAENTFVYALDVEEV